jgi:hypothetical protein
LNEFDLPLKNKKGALQCQCGEWAGMVKISVIIVIS